MPKLISSDSISIQKAIIHFLDLNTTEAVVSNKTTAIDDDIDDYLKAHIEKAFNSDDIKKCEFEREGFVSQNLTDLRHNFVEFSQALAQRFFGVMQDAGTIPSGDLIEVLANIGPEEFFCVFKMNYKTSFVHEFRAIAETHSINFVKHHGILPGKTAKLDEAFLINLDTWEIYLLEKKFEINGVKDFYISPTILGCTDTLSVKSQVQLVRKTAEKIYQEHYGETVDMKPRVAEAIYKELHAQEQFKIENIYENFTDAFPEMGPELRSAMEGSPVEAHKLQPVPDSEYKKIARQTVKSNFGVEVKIPTKMYSNKEAVEFIHHPDGSVSLLIKGIVNGKEES